MTPTTDTATPDTEEAEEQTVWISFRCTPGQRDGLKDHAHLARVSVSDLVRRRSLLEPPPKAAVPTVNAQLSAELGAIGKNLNQQTRLCHQAGEILPAHVQPLVRVLIPLKALLDQVRLELIGADQADEEDQA